LNSLFWTKHIMDSQLVSDPQAAAQEERPKKAYRRPRLTLWGDLRDVTLGPSPGVGESGAPGMFKP
jgi:hypothetical protein